MQFKTKVALFVLIDFILCVAIFLYGIFANNFRGNIIVWIFIPIIVIGTIIYLMADRNRRNNGKKLQRKNNAAVISKHSKTAGGGEYVTTNHYVTFEIENEGRVTFNVPNPGKYLEGDKGVLTYTIGKDYDNIIQFDRYQ